MSEVHYFPRYSQPENFVTNNTLLLLLRLREYSLLKFEKFMARLCGDKCDEMQETDFRKTTPGGIMGHCYFDLEMALGGSIPDSLSELAERLRGRTWE